MSQLQTFVIFSALVLPWCFSSCPFRQKRFLLNDDVGLRDLMSRRYKESLFTKGHDEETRIRDRPSKKNLFGFCKVEPCYVGLQYRTLDGSCNNVATDFSLGRRPSKLRRLLPPEYDFRSKFAVNNSLPNPRLVSNVVHGSLVSPADYKHTVALMQWGQILDHDITLTPMIRERDGSLSDCQSCHSDPQKCSPISIPHNDPHFPSIDLKTGKPKCLEFVRSQSVGSSLWKDQLNLVTSWLDSSHVYGSFKCQSDHLRTLKGGRLKWLSHPLGPKSFKALLPRHATNHECNSKSQLCFNAGDDRANEQPGLVAMHTLLMREHNRLAQRLEYLNPNWDDEKIFQEARKIVVAINQHITYNEFLPRILGQNLMKIYNLQVDKDDYFYAYDAQCDPSIYNEFATAAFRFGHSLIPEGFAIKGQKLFKMAANISSDMVRLRRHINNPDIGMSPMFVDDLIESILHQPMLKYDRGVTDELRNHLNETEGVDFSGVDLVALNIQRGRDHGLPGYAKYQHFCALDISKRQSKFFSPSIFNSFNQLNFDSATIESLQKVYDHVQDVDLFTGGLSENSEDLGLVGPTFGCIIGLQFERLRKCDRFWYESPHKRLGFTRQQLSQIKNVSLASLMCNNLDHNINIQLRAFDVADEASNPLIPCGDHPKLDLTLWSENITKRRRKYCDVQNRMVKHGQEMQISPCTKCRCRQGTYTCTTTVHDKSCQDLMATYGPEAVLADDSCHCGHMWKNATIF